MKPITLEWLTKADDDFATMTREFRVRKRPNYTGVCFHAQQCVEKLLKGYLFEQNIDFEWTHDIRRLLKLAIPLQPHWIEFLESATILSAYAVEARYPGSFVTKPLAGNAIRMCRMLRSAILFSLDVPDELSF